MILAIDVGNTNIVMGVINEGKIIFVERLSTNHKKTELEYALDINNVLSMYNIKTTDIDGGIIASVVPLLTDIIKLSVNKVCNFEPFIVGPGIKTGVNIRLDNPAEIGADRVAEAVAVISEYEGSALIIDMGTANTISVIDENKNIIGGLIMPGILISLEALTENASQLIDINVEPPKEIIGKNTKDCMKSGVVYGNAAMIDGLISRIEKSCGKFNSIIATGGLSKLIIPYCEHMIIHDEDLLLKGLWIMYKKNKKD